MSCPERSTLLQWLDGELASSEAKAVYEHVENCSRCRGFVTAQKHMESVWRGSWVDPPDSDFTTMRQVLTPVTQWWKTPRTWYIAAAVCAAYIGVKVFYIDEAGTSLSTIVRQESSVESIPASVEQTDAEYSEELFASPVEDIEESMEEEEQIDALSDEVGEQPLSDQSVSPPAFGTEEADVSDETEVSEFQEETVDVLLSTSDTEAEIAEEESFFRSAASGVAASTDDEGSVTAGIGGGGGGLAAGTAGFAQTSMSDSPVDAAHEDAVPSAVEEAGGSLSCTVTITLESGEVFELGRDSWPSLFELIDTFSAKSSSSISELFVIRVGSDGTVSGAIVPEGTVIDVPDERYGNCEVTVLFN
jgi:hypothetical protein